MFSGTYANVQISIRKTSAHNFKRFYLIGILIISIVIPFITFTEYTLTEPVIFISATGNQNLSNSQFIKTIETINYLPSILWRIYIIGAVIFLIRFLKNLYKLFQKVKQNPKFKDDTVFHVLVQNFIIPHTFINDIFFNKVKYTNYQIPKEVLLHEKAHAKQKHSWGVIFIEILHILFWFNTLLYFIKKDIKLNHEFLADQAVIKKGVNTKNYQKLLLAFLSNASYPTLVNVINYSSIKKRFTVMNTNTSKTAL